MVHKHALLTWDGGYDHKEAVFLWCQQQELLQIGLEEGFTVEGGGSLLRWCCQYSDFEKKGKTGKFFKWSNHCCRIIAVCAHKIISSTVMNDLGICTSTNPRVLFRSVTSDLV